MENYFIKTGYQCNMDSQGRTIFSYIDNVVHSSAYQVAVYTTAQALIHQYQLQSVLDIGCGVGKKLEKFIYPICEDITGIDAESSIRYCKTKYHFGDWRVDDIENSQLSLHRQYDLIIAADVIEHLINPDKLLDYIKRYSHPNTIILISTPERDAVRGKAHFGPPKNVYHVREWNMVELDHYLRSRNFVVLKKTLVDAVTGFALVKLLRPFRPSKTCQLFVCRVNQ